MRKVTIIIPARNEEQYLAKCLESIARIDYPQDSVEVIVIDNGSTDQTVSIAHQYKAKVYTKEGNVSALRNFGAKEASHEILAFVDADCSLPSHWLKDAMSFLCLKNVGAVGCWYKIPEKKSSWVEVVWDAHMKSRRNIIGDVNWVPSGNFILPKAVFNEVGGFDEVLFTSEDVDICARIRNKGKRIYSHPKLAIEHLGEPNSIHKYFWKEAWRGQGVVQNFIRHLPQIKLNKALGLALITFFLMIGVVLGMVLEIMTGNLFILEISVAFLILIPIMLSAKALLNQKFQWKFLMPLAFLFFLYCVARASSLCEPKVWASLA
jgi:glycosyltransferase involved in cell wall biosynthesis